MFKFTSEPWHNVGHSLSHTVTDSFAAFTVGRYLDLRPKFACVARARPNANFTLQIFISQFQCQCSVLFGDALACVARPQMKCLPQTSHIILQFQCSLSREVSEVQCGNCCCDKRCVKCECKLPILTHSLRMLHAVAARILPSLFHATLSGTLNSH